MNKEQRESSEFLAFLLAILVAMKLGQIGKIADWSWLKVFFPVYIQILLPVFGEFIKLIIIYAKKRLS
jgi:hypothetical protein